MLWGGSLSKELGNAGVNEKNLHARCSLLTSWKSSGRDLGRCFKRQAKSSLGSFVLFLTTGPKAKDGRVLPAHSDVKPQGHWDFAASALRVPWRPGPALQTPPQMPPQLPPPPRGSTNSR